MNANSVIRPLKRFSVDYQTLLNIQTYGSDNLYPQRMYDLIQNSSTGLTCVERYMTFIEGNGLHNKEFAEYICNRKGKRLTILTALLLPILRIIMVSLSTSIIIWPARLWNSNTYHSRIADWRRKKKMVK